MIQCLAIFQGPLQAFPNWWPFTSLPSQIKRAGKRERTKLSCSGPSAGHETLITFWYIEWFLYTSIKHYSKGQKGPRGKTMNLDPSSEVRRASLFVSLLKLSLLFRAMHLHMVQSEFPHTWCENGFSLSMKALIMHWNLRRSCKVTAPEQCSQISHIHFNTSKVVRRSNSIWTGNKKCSFEVLTERSVCLYIKWSLDLVTATQRLWWSFVPFSLTRCSVCLPLKRQFWGLEKSAPHDPLRHGWLQPSTSSGPRTITTFVEKV